MVWSNLRDQQQGQSGVLATYCYTFVQDHLAHLLVEHQSPEQPAMETDNQPTNEQEDLGQMYSSKWLRHHFALAVDHGDWTVPKHYCDIAKLPRDQQKAWYDASKDEMKSLLDRKVWELVNLPKGQTPIKGR